MSSPALAAGGGQIFSAPKTIASIAATAAVALRCYSKSGYTSLICSVAAAAETVNERPPEQQSLPGTHRPFVSAELSVSVVLFRASPLLSSFIPSTSVNSHSPTTTRQHRTPQPLSMASGYPNSPPGLARQSSDLDVRQNYVCEEHRIMYVLPWTLDNIPRLGYCCTAVVCCSYTLKDWPTVREQVVC